MGYDSASSTRPMVGPIDILAVEQKSKSFRCRLNSIRWAISEYLPERSISVRGISTDDATSDFPTVWHRPLPIRDHRTESARAIVLGRHEPGAGLSLGCALSSSPMDLSNYVTEFSSESVSAGNSGRRVSLPAIACEFEYGFEILPRLVLEAQRAVRSAPVGVGLGKVWFQASEIASILIERSGVIVSPQRRLVVFPDWCSRLHRARRQPCRLEVLHPRRSEGLRAGCDGPEQVVWRRDCPAKGRVAG